MFCSKCGKEIGSDEKFCPSCGTPADANAAPAKAKVNAGEVVKTIGNFYGKCLGSIRTIGVNSKIYVGYMLTLLLAWLTLNTPIYAVTIKALEDLVSVKMGMSFGFGQISSILNMVGSIGDMGWIGSVFGVIGFILNAAVLASIVMAVIPVVTGAKTSKTAMLVGLIASAVSLFIFLVLWVIMLIVGAAAGSAMGGYGSVAMGPSLSGYYYLVLEILSLVLSIKIMKELKKN